MSDHTELELENYRDGYYWGGSLGTFGIPESAPRTEIERTNHHWSAVISSGGRSAQYSWDRWLRGGQLSSRYSGRIEPVEGFAEHVQDGSPELSAFEGAAETLRRRELSLEFDSTALLDDHRLLRRTVLELFERAYSGEFLGQSSGNELLSVEEVAEILWINQQLILSHIRSLVAAGKLVQEDV